MFKKTTPRNSMYKLWPVVNRVTGLGVDGIILVDLTKNYHQHDVANCKKSVISVS